MLRCVGWLWSPEEADLGCLVVVDFLKAGGAPQGLCYLDHSMTSRVHLQMACQLLHGIVLNLLYTLALLFVLDQ
jgi:hypothetical protein